MRPPAGWWRVCAPRAMCPEICFLLCNHGCPEPAQGASLTPSVDLRTRSGEGARVLYAIYPQPAQALVTSLGRLRHAGTGITTSEPVLQITWSRPFTSTLQGHKAYNAENTSPLPPHSKKCWLNPSRRTRTGRPHEDASKAA